MSIYLALDTSICGLAMGLFEHSVTTPTPHLLWSHVHREAQGSAQLITKTFLDGLNVARCKENDIAGIVIGQGPGSFTGIRVGIAFAAGLQGGFSRTPPPIIGVSALQIFALRAHCQPQSEPAVPLTMETLAVLPGTRTTGYVAVVRNDINCKVLPLDLEEAASGEWALRGEPVPKTARFLLCGDWPEFERFVGVQGTVNRLEIAAVAEQALYGMGEHVGKVDWGRGVQMLPEPLYLRRSTVEERLERGGN